MFEPPVGVCVTGLGPALFVRFSAVAHRRMVHAKNVIVRGIGGGGGESTGGRGTAGLWGVHLWAPRLPGCCPAPRPAPLWTGALPPLRARHGPFLHALQTHS